MAQRRAAVTVPATRNDAILDVENPDYGRHRRDVVVIGEAPEAPAVNENPDEVGNLEELEQADELARVLDELDAGGVGGKVRVSRYDRIRKEEAFIDEILPQEYSAKWLMDNYGGGVYRVRVYVPRRDPATGEIFGNLVKCAANKQVVIDGPAKVRRDETLNVPAVQNHDALLLAGFKSMAEGMTAGFREIAGMVQHGNKQPSMTELLQQLAMMKSVFSDARPAADPSAMFNSMLDTMKKMEEIRSIAGGGENDGGGSGISGVLVSKFIDMFAQHAAAQAGGAPAGFANTSAPPMLEPAPPAGDEPPAPPALAVVESEDEDMNVILLKVTLGQVLKHAARNTPVSEVAADLYSAAPDSLFEFLEGENWQAQLETYDARAKLYPPYIKALRDELLRLDSDDQSGGNAA